MLPPAETSEILIALPLPIEILLPLRYHFMILAGIGVMNLMLFFLLTWRMRLSGKVKPDTKAK